ncbi:MAG: hypothetical protein FGM15_11200 [Chthoniobacterales bacterium]|nr:hypothetical protein [Chthoniobacterales bacterium]
MKPRKYLWLAVPMILAAVLTMRFLPDRFPHSASVGLPVPVAKPTPDLAAPNAVASASQMPAGSTSIVAANNQMLSSAADADALRPLPPKENPEWKLLDWSLEPCPGKPGLQMRASLWSASGKHSLVRVEEEIDGSSPPRVLRRVEMVGNQVIVRLSDGATRESLQAAVKLVGGVLAQEPFAEGTWLADLPPRLEAVPDAVEALQQTQIAEYAEPNFLVRPMRIPNDPRVADFSQWHLFNNNQIDKDIRAPRAWDRRTSAAYGSTNKVIVAVIDSGVRYTHEDLAANMWTNPGETPADGLDNDGNGLVDDVYGADYLGGDGDPMTTASHGTHCAGLIGAVGNNGLGVSGVAWTGVQIMALRFLDGTGSTSDNIQCIDYAIAKGAKVISASYGSLASGNTEAAAIYRAQQAGIVFVAAAGNDGTNNDSTPFYPASYTEYVSQTFLFRQAYALNNIIAVGATDRNDGKASFSNYGATSVDLMAPGVEMWSTTISGTSDSGYTSGQGTSFAAPVVAGAVALLIAEYPNDTVAQRVARVINTNAVDVIPSLSGLCVTGGRLNLAKLLPAADPNTLPQALVWHRPAYTEPLLNSPMRTPGSPVYSNSITIYSGVKKFNNTNGINTSGLVNQTGGWLFYRSSPSASWSSNALSWHANNGDYQFWKAVISNAPAGVSDYFLQLDFDSGARTTYSYYAVNADGFACDTNAATAGAAPYSFTVDKALANITLAGFAQLYDGTPKAVLASTDPEGLPVSLTYSGASQPPSATGSYEVQAVVSDQNYRGEATGTLSIQLSSFDAWRLQNFGASWESRPASSAGSDADGDGVNNHAEYFLGTEPNNANSALKAALLGVGNNMATLEISPAVTNGTYVLKAWSDLEQAASTSPLIITNGGTSAVFDLPVATDKGFYQVIYQPPALP